MTSDPEQLLLDSISIKEPLLDPTKEHFLDLVSTQEPSLDPVAIKEPLLDPVSSEESTIVVQDNGKVN